MIDWNILLVGVSLVAILIVILFVVMRWTKRRLSP